MVLLAIGSTLSSGGIAANAKQRTARRSLARQATKARLHFHDTTQLRGTMEPFPCPALIPDDSHDPGRADVGQVEGRVHSDDVHCHFLSPSMARAIVLDQPRRTNRFGTS
jgi:hypothetical protein